MNNSDSTRAENESVSDTGLCVLTETDLALINGGFGCGPQGPWCYGNTSFGEFYDGNCQFGGGYGGQFGDGWSGGRRRCNY